MYADRETDTVADVDVRRFWALPPSDVSHCECKCGGGRFLGKIHSIAMYENHAMFCELYSEEEGSTPFLNKDYFKVLQTFEVATKGALHVNYDIRVNNLFHAWEECKKVLSSDFCHKPSETRVLLYYAASDSALLILNPAWKNVGADVKNKYYSVFYYIMNILKDMKYKNSTKICSFMISLIEKPWGHHNLPKILNGYASHNDVVNFIEFESSNIYALRLRILCQIECETEVLRLSSLAMNAYNCESKNRQYFEDQDFEFIRDIYYACLIWQDKKTEVINHIKQYCPQSDGMILLKSYSYKIKGLSELPNEIRPRIYRCLVMVTEMASCTILAVSLINSEDFDAYCKLINIWSMIINTLMKSDLDFSMHGSRLKDMIYTFVNMAPTAVYIYKICDILNDEFGSNLPRTMLIDIYTKALCSNINEKEMCKQSNDYNGSFDSLGTLVKGYLKLANVVEDILSVCRECVLTAYSLMPSGDLLIAIEKLAVKSGKLFSSTNVPENFCKYNDVSLMNIKIEKRCRKKSKACKSDQKPNDRSYTKIQNDLSNLPDPLSTNAIDDLISVIKSPRFGSFNWNLEWSKMKVMCKQYLDNLNTVIHRNMLRPSDFKYLNMDIEEYNNWRENEIKRISNDGDYFNSDDDSIVSAASSGEVLCYSEKNSKIISRKRKRIRKRKVGSQKRKKVGNIQKPAKEKKMSSLKISKSKIERFECKTKQINCPTESNQLPAKTRVLPERRCLRSQKNVTENDNDISSKPVPDNKKIKLKIKEQLKSQKGKRQSVGKNQHNDYVYSCRKKGKFNSKNILSKSKQSNNKSNNSHFEPPPTASKNKQNDYEDSRGKKRKFDESKNSTIKEKFNSGNNILNKNKQSNNKSNNSHVEFPPTADKNQHNDYEDSCRKKEKFNERKTEIIKQEFNSDTNNILCERIPKLSLQCIKSVNTNYILSDSKQSNCTSNNLHSELPSTSKEHLNMLSARIPLLNSLEFIRPVNTNHIVNVVQIQTTSNTLTNVTQTQTEHVSNHHSNDGIEKKPNDKQTHSLDNFVSVYQSNSLNNCVGSKNSETHQGECSFTGSVSLSNQRITTDSITNVHNINQQEISKPIETHDQNTNLDHRRWNDIHLQNSSERLQSTTENPVHLSSNVIVRTSDIINPSHVTQTSGQITNITKKQSAYYVKARDRFIDLSLPASISSISTNTNRSTNIQQIINSNKSHFDSKIQQNSPVQTSVGSQVNFNNEQSEDIQNMISQSNQSSQKCTNISENSTSTNISLLNDQINTTNSSINTSPMTKPTSFTRENNLFDNLKSSMSNINPISSIQTQTCTGLRPSNEISNPNTSVLSLMITSAQSQVIKPNIHNSLYTSSQNQKVQLPDSQTKRSDEQKKIDNLKLISQTFTATSEAIKFVTSSTESQRLIQSTDKKNTSNITIFQNAADNVTNLSQENDASSKSLTKGRGNMRTYESKTKALKQANMSDMFVFEKGTLYAVQDDASQMESKSVISPRNNTITNIRLQSTQANEPLEKPKPSPTASPTASPNITITGSMLPRFQHVFGKTKFPSSTVVNDTSSLCSTSVTSNPINPGIVVNRTNITSRVYSSSKGVQTNHDIDPIISNTMNCMPSKVVENKLHNVNITKAGTVMAIGNNKNNVIMTCKTVSSIKNIPQVSPSSSRQLITSNIDNNVKKEFTGMPISKVPTTFTTSCNNSSSNSNVIYSIPIQSDSKSNSIIEKHSHAVTQVQKQLKVTPSIIKSVLCKHPTWQNNSFRQGKQSTEVQTSSTLIPSNIVKTTIESSNNKVSTNINKQNVTEQNVSSSMMEQVREFESVLEEVRKTSLMNEMSTASMLPQINHEIIQIHSPTENVDLLNADSNQTLFPLNKKLNINNKRDHCSFSFLNQTLSNDLASEDKEPVATSSSVISVRSSTPTPRATSPNNNDVSVNPVDGSTQCSKQIANKSKPVIKTPASSPSTSAVKVPVLQKPVPKLQEDEQTAQRIYAILDKYAEQLRNSPELKNKPAPRRRTNPPTNPSLNAKRKKSNQLNLKTCSQQTSCSSSGMEMSPTSDMHAIDSEDSSNAVSHFSHINNSPSRNSDEQSTTTAISETPLIENALINVNDVIKKINVDAENKSKVSQTTQIVVSGASGSFLSIPEGSAGNVRLLVASGKNQKMYRLHCPVTGQGPVVFHQITTKDSNTNDIKISSLQNINESTILSALTSDDLQVTNTSLGNEILLNTSQKAKVFEHKINKPDIILESMEKAQVLENNEKQLSFPVLKKSQASQSTFSVIHTLPCNSKSESISNIELLSEVQNHISKNIKKKYCNNEQTILNTKQETIKNISIQQEKLSKTLKDEQPFILPESSASISFEDLGFPSFHSQELEQENDEGPSSINSKNSHQNIINTDKNKNSQISVDCLNDNKVSNNSNNLHESCAMVDQEKLSNVTTNVTTIENSKEEEKERNETNLVLNNVAAASAAEIISNANQTSNTYKQKDELSSKIGKTECESENENENTLSNTVYNLLDNQSATNMNTKIGSLTFRLINDRSAKNWNSCLSKIMPPGTEKMLEGENLKQLQESFQHTKIKTFKDLKMFVFEQCKKFDNNVETPKEYDLYDDIDGLGVDKPSTNELFPEVAILNDLDKSVSPTLGLLQASTSKSNDTITLQARRKSVLSHTTTSTSIMTGTEQTTSVAYKKNKTKVSFLKQALYNEMNQDSNDCETKLFINGNTKTILDAIEQIDSSPESPLNTTAVDSETCMSEDSTSTISSGTPHYNFRKSKRKHIEEDGFIESQVIKRMYRGRTSEDSEEKSETPKINQTKVLVTEQKSTFDKKESNSRRISSRLKNNNVKNNQHNHHASNKSPQLDSPPYKITTTRTSLRRVSRKTT